MNPPSPTAAHLFLWAALSPPGEGWPRAWVEKTGQGRQLRGTAGPHGSSGKPGAPAPGRGSAQSGPEFGDKAGSSPTECSPRRGSGRHLSALPVARSGVIGHRGPRTRNTESCSPQRARDRREAPPAPRDDEVSPTLKCPRRQGSGYAASSEEGPACPRGHSGLVGRGLRTSALPTLPGRPRGPRPLAPSQPRAQAETHTPSPLVLVLWGHSTRNSTSATNLESSDIRTLFSPFWGQKSEIEGLSPEAVGSLPQRAGRPLCSYALPPRRCSRGLPRVPCPNVPLLRTQVTGRGPGLLQSDLVLIVSVGTLLPSKGSVTGSGENPSHISLGTHFKS